MISKNLSIILIITAIMLVAGFSVTGRFAEVMPAIYKNQVSSDPEPALKEFSIQSGHVLEDGKRVPRFLTKEITVNKGDRVRITITNIQGSHDFKIDEFNAYVETPLNQTVTVEFIADRSGEFIYYCSKPGHHARGHFGTLIVNEP